MKLKEKSFGFYFYCKGADPNETPLHLFRLSMIFSSVLRKK